MRVALLLTLLALAGPVRAADDPAAEARALAKSGDLAAALAIYDRLMAEAISDPLVANEALRAAIDAKDPRRFAQYGEAWLRHDPSNFNLLRLMPAAHAEAGDTGAAMRSRDAVMAAWPRAKATSPPAITSFVMDRFSVDNRLVIARQCLERAGQSGVVYRFDIVENGRLVSCMTLESSDLENQIARETWAKGSTERIATLDAFLPGMHQTVTMLMHGIPSYPEVKQLGMAPIAAAAARASQAWRT